MQKIFLLIALLGVSLTTIAQENTNQNKFKQLGEELPTPNVYRTGSGAPGHAYWQQKADYKMDITLDDEKQTITGEETITYHNNSPDILKYLWVQLDQNVRAENSQTHEINNANISGGWMYMWSLNKLHNDFKGGFNITSVRGSNNKKLEHTINYTMMRVELTTPLKPGEKFEFKIDWNYQIQDRMKYGGRSGYEYFEKDDNYLYTIAQFFPRMCVYDDVNGWQNKQFLGRGEFALPFGDYEVNLTVPSDHVVSASGVLQNPDAVMTNKQQRRFKDAKKSFDKPVIIVTQEEAVEAEKKENKKKKMKTWEFRADNVRDFGFASSRKFIWDAQAVKVGDRTVMAMSFYPKEGNPLWEEFSTKAVVKTLEIYSKHTFDYPYPVAQSVHAADIGMEYPMICFNFGRPDEDGTYSDRTKYGMISVIIHEVGHNYFPMIVNSDERQWTWMDEGLNTFLQYLTEKEFEEDYPSRRGPASKIVRYMKGDKNRISPIMTNSESIFQFGNNAYGKPATALNILRETVMGPELFDYAFKEYAQRWMFKHPSPADFFRTMEDASAFDLDWFWRGWFYTNDNVDIAIEGVRWFKVQTDTLQKVSKGLEANMNKPYFFNPIYAENADKYQESLDKLSEKEMDLLKKGYNYYEIKFENVGGLVMPLLLRLEYEDGTIENRKIPAEIWRYTGEKTAKTIVTDKKLTKVNLDIDLQTADTDTDNNVYPRAAKEETKIEKMMNEKEEAEGKKELSKKDLKEMKKRKRKKKK